SAALAGDVQARVTGLFSQKTDVSGQFPSDLTADATNARLNDVDYPIEMDSRGAVQDKWKIQFTGATSFNVISEQRGQVETGATTADCAPVNPVTGVPYFVIKKEAWGTGWQSGNIVRFDTEAAAFPVWCIRSIQPGPASLETDSFSVQARGDTDQ
ncbi:MAG: hypothetical protein CMB99_16175, partial [Flavobacteriaceae bacterium]|nr:hypothetical protein [Flavobacteriaceae bacterium]